MSTPTETFRSLARAAPTAQAAPYWRPKTRGECLSLPRPCAYVGCRYNLTLDVTFSGAIRYRQEDACASGESNCALDLAAQKARDSEEVGKYMGVSGARVRQEEVVALRKLRAVDDLAGPRDVLAEDNAVYTEPDERHEAAALGLKEMPAWMTKVWRNCLQGER